LESTNFSLNDEEFSKINEISNQVDSEVLILFWQFAISSLEELNIVSNQHLSIEMFLIRLMHLSSIKLNKNIDQEESNNNSDGQILNEKKEQQFADNSRTVNQIKNVAQEEKQKPEVKPELKVTDKNLINSFDELLNICTQKKEIKLKYELEKNVNLVKFERNRIEISFNDNLDKDFVKDLSSKLYEWTTERWIITFSKFKGEMSVKEKQKNKKYELINEVKNLEIYKKVMEKFPDAELVNVKLNEKKEDKND
jgi:DNA polymerase III subunit gamma/tau